MTAKIFRYEVPVDDQWHTLRLSGSVLHIAARRPTVVEVWALHSGGPGLNRTFCVFGTGQPLPDEQMRYVGTAIAAGGSLVWHLMERGAAPVVLDGTN